MSFLTSASSRCCCLFCLFFLSSFWRCALRCASIGFAILLSLLVVDLRSHAMITDTTLYAALSLPLPLLLSFAYLTSSVHSTTLANTFGILAVLLVTTHQFFAIQRKRQAEQEVSRRLERASKSQGKAKENAAKEQVAAA